MFFLFALFNLALFDLTFSLKVFVSKSGSDSLSCGLDTLSSCLTVEHAMQLFLESESSPLKSASHAQIEFAIDQGEYSTSVPIHLFYSRFEFFNDVAPHVLFKGAAGEQTVLKLPFVIKGDMEDAQERTHGSVTFENLSFASTLLVQHTADAFPIRFNTIWFHATLSDFVVVQSESRGALQFSECVFDACGVTVRRAAQLTFAQCTFTGTIDGLSVPATPAVDPMAENAAVVDPMRRDDSLRAFVASAATKTSFSNCQFVGVESDGHFSLIHWDGRLFPLHADHDPVAPTFDIVGSTFEDIKLFHENDIGGALVFFDCLDATVRDKAHTCDSSVVRVSQSKVRNARTGHSLFLVVGGHLSLDSLSIDSAQHNQANNHSGAVIVLDHAKATIHKTTVKDCGLQSNGLRHPHLWQLAGAIVAVDSSVEIRDSSFEQLRGWQSGVLWCKNSQVNFDVATIDMTEAVGGTEVAYDQNNAFHNVFGDATGNTDKRISCGAQCSVTEVAGESTSQAARSLCPKTFQGRQTFTLTPSSACSLRIQHFAVYVCIIFSLVLKDWNEI